MACRGFGWPLIKNRENVTGNKKAKKGSKVTKVDFTFAEELSEVAA